VEIFDGDAFRSNCRTRAVEISSVGVVSLLIVVATRQRRVRFFLAGIEATFDRNSD
jgi:hypothetical protein